jgi:hypothetical protein
VKIQYISGVQGFKMPNKALQGGRRENGWFLAVLLKKVWYFIFNI